MAKVVIAELDIDINALLKSTSELKKEIDALKNTQKDLAASGDKSSEAFVQNEAVLKSLNSAYASNVKVIQESGQATKTQADQAQLLNMALTQEATSIAEARQQNQMLNKLRNETNVTTAEGQAQLTALNKKLDTNNDFIKENADAYLKQKINIGNYKDSVLEALEEMEANKKALIDQKNTLLELQKEQEKGSDTWIYYNNQINQTNNQINVLVTSMGGLNDEQNASSTLTNLLSGNFKSLGESAQAAGGAGNLLKSSLSGATSGMMGMVKASLAFIATPIGAILAAIVLAFALVKNAMSRSEEATNKVTKIFTIFSGIVGKLISFLEPLGDFLIDGIVMGFELAGKAADKALSLISGGLSMLGFDGTSKSVKGFQNEMKVAAKEAGILADAEARLEKQQRLSQKVQLDYQKDAEKLRQIRDNENLTIAQRIKANDELGVVLKKQLSEELKIAQLALQVANARIKAEGKTKETLDAQAEALTTISDIQERISGQESEQIVNRVALQKEAAEKQKEIADKAKERRQKEIDDLIAKSNIQIELFKTTEGAKQKTAEQTADFNKKLYEKETANLQLQFDKGKISKEQYELEKLQLSQNYAKQQADSLMQFANAELNLFLETNKSKLIGAETLTAELVAEEEKRLKLIEQKRIENLAKDKEIDVAKLEAKKLNNEQLTVAEVEFETERIKISGETDATIQANKKTLEEQIKAQKAEQLVIDKELALAEAETKAEEDAIKAEQDYRTEIARLTKLLTDKKITEDQFRALKKSADEKSAENERLSSLNKTQAQLQEFQKVGAGLEGLFGKNKAISSATALINGGLAVTEILKTPSVLPEPAASISRAIQIGGTIATTTRSIAQINSAKFEKGGIQEIGGKRHSAGGTKFWGEDGTQFEAEAGEGIGILNRRAFSSFMDFNNSNGGGVSRGGFFQGGGIITQGVRPETLNIDSVVDAIASMPAPIVAVEEIQTVGNRYAQVVSGANL